MGTDVQSYVDEINNLAVEDPEEVRASILNRTLTATTMDEILGRPEVAHAKDIIGHPVTIDAVRWMKSDMDNGPGVYAVIEGLDHSTGEKLTVTCGAEGVMAQLFRLGQLKLFPCSVVLREAEKPTAQGFKPMWLDPCANPEAEADTPFD